MNSFQFNYLLFYFILVSTWIAQRLLRRILYGKANFWRGMSLNLLMIYFCYLFGLTFYPFVFTVGQKLNPPNLIPFIETLQMVQNGINAADGVTGRVVFFNVIGNLVLFVPIGFFLPMLFKKLRGGLKLLVLGFLLSLLVELIQYYLEARVFDIDDLMLNSLGAWLGYSIFWLLYWIRPVGEFFERVAQADRPHGTRALILFVLIVALSAAAIFVLQYQAVLSIPQ